jgi:hypothetical protein
MEDLVRDDRKYIGVGGGIILNRILYKHERGELD